MRTFKTKQDQEAWECNVRQELAAAEEQVQDKETFYKLTSKISVHITDSNLSGTACRLWIYLAGHYQFGDRFEYMPTQSELAVRLGVSRQSILRAIADLEEAQLWEFKIEKWKGKNLTGHGSQGKVLLSCDRGNNFGTPGNNFDTPGNTDDTPCTKNDFLHNNDRARIQTNSDLVQTQSDTPSISPSTLEEEGGEEEASLNQEHEQEDQTTIALPVEDKLPDTLNLVESILEDKAPAAAPEVETTLEVQPRQRLISAAQKNDDLFAPLAPWRTSKKRGAFKKDFVEYLQKEYLPQTSLYKDRKVTVANAEGWITTREYDEKGLSEIEVQLRGFGAWKEEQSAQSARRASFGLDDNATPRAMTDGADHWRQLDERMRAAAQNNAAPVLKSAEPPCDEYLKAKAAVRSHLPATSRKSSMTSLAAVIEPPAPVSEFEYIKESMQQQVNSDNEDLRNEAFAWAKENGFSVVRDRVSRALIFQEIDF